jgi:glycerate dehydrogenase
MRIVVLDGYTLNPGDNPWNDVARLGDLTVYDRTAPAQTIARAADAEIVLTNKTVLDAAVIAALAPLRFISVLATGYDVVDIGAARRRGISVSNVPEYSSKAVVQHTIALLLELCQRVGDHARAVAASEWTRAPDFCFWLTPPRELSGLTLGIVGLGRIGRRVAAVAQALGMRVIAAARTDAPAPGDSIERRALSALFAESDVVSLHCPLTAATARMVNGTLLAGMKPTAVLINTARGGLIDEQALADALTSGRLGGAALDVLSSEPPHADNPLLRAPNCIITPHIAWASLAARRTLMAETARNIEAFLARRPVNVVNP